MSVRFSAGVTVRVRAILYVAAVPAAAAIVVPSIIVNLLVRTTRIAYKKRITVSKEKILPFNGGNR